MWSNSSNSFILSLGRSRNRNTFITVVVLGIVILTILLSYSVFGKDSYRENDSSLVSVHIVFRHGERSPSSFYFNDPYKDIKYWPDGLGQLNNKGKEGLYYVGKKLRKRYNKELSPFYLPRDVTIRSSYADRCQMSALTLLAGLFPPVQHQIWNKDLLWQPVPINSVPRIYDNVIVIGRKCPFYSKLKEDVQRGLLSNFTHQQKELLQYLTLNTGQNVTTAADVESLYFTLLIEKEYGYEIPLWAEEVFPVEMKAVAELLQASFSWNTTLQKFASGGMTSEWKEHLLTESEAGNSKFHMYLYSSHDLTLLNVIRGLGFDIQQLFDYGAALILEHIHDKNGNYVELYTYKSSYSDVAEKLIIPNCDIRCPTDKFLELLTTVIPENWDEDCKIR